MNDEVLVQVETTVQPITPATPVAEPANNAGYLLVLVIAVVLFVAYRMFIRFRERSRDDAGEITDTHPAPPPAVTYAAPGVDENEIGAVIAAAVAMMMDGGQFAAEDKPGEPPDEPSCEGPRRPRRAGRAIPAWSRAGREELIYGRM